MLANKHVPVIIFNYLYMPYIVMVWRDLFAGLSLMKSACQIDFHITNSDHVACNYRTVCAMQNEMLWTRAE